MTKRDKVTVDNIIGLVHTDEMTNSVEEVRKIRGRTNERFIVDDTGTLIDMETRNTYDYVSDVVDLLNDVTNELRIAQSVIQMKREQISSLAKSNREGVKKVQSLAKENEQLKQFKSKVLELLDEKIKHYEHKPFSAPIGQPMSVNFDADMDRLARLSELQCLKKELQE